jgi:hypothetical protein
VVASVPVAELGMLAADEEHPRGQASTGPALA